MARRPWLALAGKRLNLQHTYHTVFYAKNPWGGIGRDTGGKGVMRGKNACYVKAAFVAKGYVAVFLITTCAVPIIFCALLIVTSVFVIISSVF